MAERGIVKVVSDNNKYMAEYMSRRYKKRRIAGIDALGGKCVRCGDDREAVLHFHHRSPGEKSFVLARGLAGFSSERINAELAKCELLCVECHKKAHAVFNEHGTTRRFAQGCRCEYCRAAWRTNHNEWRRRHRAKQRERSAEAGAAGL